MNIIRSILFEVLPIAYYILPPPGCQIVNATPMTKTVVLLRDTSHRATSEEVKPCLTSA